MGEQVAIRNCKTVRFEEVKAHYRLLGIDGLDEHKNLEGWHYCQVRVAALRNMHGDFGRPEAGFIALRKGEHLQKQLELRKWLVDSGEFPRSDRIRQDWPDKPAIIAQRTKSSGELYVSDGVTRTFNACYHNEPWIDAYIIELDQDRDVVD